MRLPAPCSFKSAPTQNARPAPVRMTARIAGSRSANDSAISNSGKLLDDRVEAVRAVEVNFSNLLFYSINQGFKFGVFIAGTMKITYGHKNKNTFCTFAKYTTMSFLVNTFVLYF